MRTGTIRSLNAIDGNKSGVLTDTLTGVAISFQPHSVRNVGPGTVTTALTVGMSVKWEPVYAGCDTDCSSPASMIQPA